MRANEHSSITTPPLAACRPTYPYDADVLQAIDRGMPLDYHDCRPGFPGANTGRAPVARGGRRGVSAADLWRAPGGTAGAASAAGGARHRRHQAPVRLRGADLPLGAGAETVGPVEGAEHHLDEHADALD